MYRTSSASGSCESSAKTEVSEDQVIAQFMKCAEAGTESLSTPRRNEDCKEGV